MGLRSHCDGCASPFTVEHGLSCKKGGFVSIRHDDVRDEAGALAGQALTTGKITYEPSISYGRNLTAGQPEVPQGTGNQLGAESRGNVLVHGLWERGSGCVLDIRITDTDANSHKDISSAKVLERAAKAKKAKYLQPCLERRQSFTPLVYSVDGMTCKEAKAFSKRIACLLAKKWDRPSSEMVGYMRGRMGIAVFRLSTVLLWGARVHKRTVPWVWDDTEYETVREQNAER